MGLPSLILLENVIQFALLRFSLDVVVSNLEQVLAFTLKSPRKSPGLDLLAVDCHTPNVECVANDHPDVHVRGDQVVAEDETHQLLVFGFVLDQLVGQPDFCILAVFDETPCLGNHDQVGGLLIVLVVYILIRYNPLGQTRKARDSELVQRKQHFGSSLQVVLENHFGSVGVINHGLEHVGLGHAIDGLVEVRVFRLEKRVDLALDFVDESRSQVDLGYFTMI